ncbi:N-carbamoyl-beta-alanine amidohydrolase protein [Erwinia tasmaniensis Et1/99]|uniref:N-carbamoyl-beta-alanine amidohydrolase protein n=2 Tax=Erwinia tasmaniensis TaxID=338565 RepID=B2VFW2_ERWT9|nr:N-carbamoyl-beta-alanine amidohydrolase protein [Erwinia tasmaniensis Et1/99]
MAKIGPGKSGGSNRQALTDEDNQGRELFCRWCKEAGLAISVDQMGTIFATREGTEPDLPGVYIGSHLDTQPTGGKFDGVLGVVAALEVVRTLNEYQVKTKRSIIVTNWTNEEGSRFVPSMLASAVFSGVYSLEYAYGLKDREGITLHHELKRTGWLGTEPVGARKIHSYVEYHIEQGPILESKHKSVGVVTHCQGQSWLEVTLTGRSAHTGSTPMNMRKNACLAMARIINIVDDIAMKLQPNVAGSVGQINMLPNSRNALPETAIFTIDLRAVDKDKFITLCELVETEVQKIAQEHNVLCSIERIGHYEPIEFDKQITEVVKNSAIQLGYDFMEITSGAGHDATWISGVAPTSMIFCPCVDGISHHESEDITQEWAESGANVLLHTAITLSNA